MIPVLKPSPGQEEIALLTEAINSGWWGMGPRCEEFEQKMAARYRMKHCITLNSCTAALHLSLLAEGVGPGDEVIVPALTFISTALAASYCGATPVFVDVEPDSLCLDWDAVQEAITPRTKVIVPVDYAGYPAAEPGWFLSEPSLVPIVQDAAHSCGGLAYGSEVCLSFHAVKNLATGDGGAILTNDDQKAERIRALRWCGIDRSTWERAQKRYGWDYAIQEIGYKCHWNDIQASIGLAQLGRLEELNARRRAIAERYTRDLSPLPIQLPRDDPKHTWHLYPIRVGQGHDGIRDQLVDWLLSLGISAGVHYKPLTYYPMYSHNPTPPITDREWRRLVSLPIFPDMTDVDQSRVVSALWRFFGRSD